MKKIAIVCVLVALAACSKGETKADQEAAAAAAAAAEVPIGPYSIEPGTYLYTRSDGVTGVNTLVADGTFSNAVTGGAVETGKWEQKGDQGCLTPDDGSEVRCYTFSHPDAQGNFTGVMPNGLTVEVRKTS